MGSWGKKNFLHHCRFWLYSQCCFLITDPTSKMLSNSPEAFFPITLGQNHAMQVCPCDDQTCPAQHLTSLQVFHMECCLHSSQGVLYWFLLLSELFTGFIFHLLESLCPPEVCNIFPTSCTCVLIYMMQSI